MLISHSIQQTTRFNCKKVHGCKLSHNYSTFSQQPGYKKLLFRGEINFLVFVLQNLWDCFFPIR